VSCCYHTLQELTAKHSRCHLQHRLSFKGVLWPHLNTSLYPLPPPPSLRPSPHPHVPAAAAAPAAAPSSSNGNGTPLIRSPSAASSSVTLSQELDEQQEAALQVRGTQALNNNLALYFLHSLCLQAAAAMFYLYTAWI
jgi:hypothetical protein